MGQLTLNIIEQSEVKVIASSAFNFRVEIVYQLGKSDMNDIFEISKDLAEIFDNNFLLNEEFRHISPKKKSSSSYLIGDAFESYKRFF